MIEIRALQHFLYCPHRWEMLYLEDMWQENALTVNADLVHSRVHNEKLLSSYRGRISLGSVTLYSQKYGIYGKADCMELVPEQNGVHIVGFEGTYKILLVEYKPTQRKSGVSPADRLQLYAQTVCARELFSGAIASYIYYADTKKRVKIEFDGNDEVLLKTIVAQIETYAKNGIIPPPEYGKKCSGCSLYERCMPKPMRLNVRDNILRSIECENY